MPALQGTGAPQTAGDPSSGRPGLAPHERLQREKLVIGQRGLSDSRGRARKTSVHEQGTQRLVLVTSIGGGEIGSERSSRAERCPDAVTGEARRDAAGERALAG